MKIEKADIFAGRKRLKALQADARAVAALAIAEAGEAGDDMRWKLRFQVGLKTKNLHSLVVVKNGDKWSALLVLADAPRGMPNVIQSVEDATDEAGAIENGKRLLEAAYVMILDHKAQMAAGTADNVRLFEAGEISLSVPWEIMNYVGRQIPESSKPENLEAVRKSAMAEINKITNGGTMTPDHFMAMDDNGQAGLMIAAARALCTGSRCLEKAVNEVAAA